MPKPFHERLREIIPESVKKRIPEPIKEKLRPPAWREPEPPPPDPNVQVPDWARGPEGAVKFIPGTRAMIFSQKPGAGTTVTQDAKGRPLPTAINLPYGTEGTITGVGPDFIVFRVGPENEPVTKDRPAAIFRVPKEDVIHVKPEAERDWTRRGYITITAADLLLFDEPSDPRCSVRGHPRRHPAAAGPSQRAA
jgi:hypothetical protein